MKNHRTFFYKLMAILLPVIILVMIEGLLRLFHYGYDSRLFIPDEDDKRFLVMNRNISKKYFTYAENATIGNREEFFEQKKRGSLRFFVLGASSSLGFPYMHNGAFPRMLKYRLQFEYPDKTVEIINLSLTAINSYTLADFAKQVADHQPDGVLIYAGHNEYYGALGIASTNRQGRNPTIIHAMLKTKNLKLVQCISQIMTYFRKTDYQLTDANLTLMQRMAAGKEIDFQSELFFDGIKQFDYNMQSMLRIFNEKQIPVFIGTLISNLGGQKPLGTSEKAQLEFNAGKEALLQSDHDLARQHFLLAKEYDNLRFRAPEAMNEKIRGYATSFSNVRLVDIQNIFETSSPYGIIGHELLLEHVHPNLEGHRLMADAFFDKLTKMFPSDNDMGILPEISRDDYPFTVFDTICGDLSVRLLKTQWPFNEPSSSSNKLPNTMESRIAASFLEKKITWDEAMQQLYERYIRTNNFANALRVNEGMCLELPHYASFISKAAKLCMHLEKNEKAVFYLLKEHQMTSSTEAAADLAVTLLKLDQPEKALFYIDIVLHQSPQRQNFRFLKNITQQMIQVRKALDEDPGNKELRKQVAGLYLQMGYRSSAAKYSDE